MRLEDIDIIGAIGDSDTAAFAANSRGGLDYFTEYRGVSFATGTDGSWANNPSLANLLRACNPGLEGDRRIYDFWLRQELKESLCLSLFGSKC